MSSTVCQIYSFLVFQKKRKTLRSSISCTALRLIGSGGSISFIIVLRRIPVSSEVPPVRGVATASHIKLFSLAGQKTFARYYGGMWR